MELIIIDTENQPPVDGDCEAELNCPSELYFFHPDHIGSSTFLTDEDGNPYQFMVYLPFGESMADQKAGGYSTKYRFTGKEVDEETGLYYFGARYYDPRISLWYGVDPMTEKHPDYNPFGYTANNPIRFIDPDGQDWYEDECSGKMQWFEGSGKQGGFIYRGAEYQSGRNFYTTTSDGKNPLSFNDAFQSVEVCADRICKDPTSISNSILSDAWNSPAARAVVPDKVGFSFSTSATAAVGTSNSLNIDWITRGNDASLIPYVTLTGGFQGGIKASADANINFNIGWFNSPDLRNESTGITSNGLLGWSAYGGGSVGAGANLNVSGSLGFRENPGSKPTWLTIGIGTGGGIGGGTSGGLSLTAPLFNSQFRRK